MKKNIVDESEQGKRQRGLFALYFVLRLIVVAVAVAQAFNKNWSDLFLCILTLILFMLPSFIERKIKISIPTVLEATLILLVFSAEILGEILAYYLSIPFWDSILHVISGFLCAAIGFSLIDLLNRSERFYFSLSPAFSAMVAICFSMSIGTLWEFLEFGCDLLFKTDMQKDALIHEVNTVLLHPDGKNDAIHVVIERVVVNGERWPGYIDIGLYDTMIDLLVNFSGAVVFTLVAYLLIRNDRAKVFFRKLTLTRKKRSNH